MKVIIWSDNHNFPSLPAMKISAWHKSKGDIVKILETSVEPCDIFYECKAFSDIYSCELESIPQCQQHIKGGSGYAISVKNGKEVYEKEKDVSLANDIEYQYPDYELYPQYKNNAYGFLTRGCCNNCSFCIVSKKEGMCSKQVSNLSEFWNGQNNIKLMDGNLLACKAREILLQQLIDSGASIDYTQGLDARFITNDIAKLICKTNIKMLHFAFDFMENESKIIKGLETFKQYAEVTDRELKVYILTNYNTTHAEDWYRVKKVMELGYSPDIRIYQKGTHDQFLTDLARWANNSRIYRSSDFSDYIPRKDGKSCKILYPEVLKGAL